MTSESFTNWIMQMISSPGPIFEPKPLTAIRSSEESLEVDLMALEDDLIEDLFRRFNTNRVDSNSNSTNTKSSSSDGPSNSSEIEILNIDSD